MQINPVLRRNTSTGKIMQEIGELATSRGWESWIAYSRGRDGVPDELSAPKDSKLLPVGSRLSVALHGLETRLFDRHGLGSRLATRRFVKALRRLDYQKSFDRLIEAWKIVHSMAPDWRLDIFGQGEWKELLQKQIADAGLEECCAINAPTNDIVGEYVASSMIVMSSHYEGFPMVLIEGMACGLPAVSFDYKCGPRDIIRDGVDGYIASDGDVDDLAQGILLLIKDGQLRRDMGQAAREVVRRFSLDSVMEKWLSVYKDA